MRMMELLAGMRTEKEDGCTDLEGLLRTQFHVAHAELETVSAYKEALKKLEHKHGEHGNEGDGEDDSKKKRGKGDGKADEQ